MRSQTQEARDALKQERARTRKRAVDRFESPGRTRPRMPTELPTRAPRADGTTNDERALFARRFPVHVGVDTGKVFHKLVARGPDGRRLKAMKVMVSRDDFDGADAYLTKLFPGIRRSEMLVGVEFGGHHGLTFAHYLIAKGYQVVNVLPSVTKKLKEVEDNSPRKDDAKDAAQICKLLEGGHFVTFMRLSEVVSEMRVLTTERERLTRETTRLKNRLQALLDVAWPEFTLHFCSIAKPTPRALLRRWPLPQDLLASRASTVVAQAREVSRGHVKTAQVMAILDAARSTVAVTTGAEGRRAEIIRVLDRWTLLEEHTDGIDRRLEELVAQHAGAKALTTVPGVGVVCAATLVAEVGTPETFKSPRQILKLAGMNLAATKDSGVSMRSRPRQTKRGRPALRRQLFLLAARWCSKRGYYHHTYTALKARNGNSKVKAMCAVARKLVPMLFVIMQTGEPFDLLTWHRNRHQVPEKAA